MVAYSFKVQFIEPIAARRKMQTVRAARKRHARPGEAMQLYSGMRTKYCRKIVEPDPICRGVDDIRMRIVAVPSPQIDEITINSVPLSADEMEAFAVADGFASALADGFALHRMAEFWIKNHAGDALGIEFEGVVLRWGWDG